ncbi:carbohydrate porin [Pseudomonas sp. A014]|uniref:carbohydrate porin n=1 Tax=Pseudomonas sp. A014 TaxID=3458058 RepID=UPI004035E443
MNASKTLLSLTLALAGIPGAFAAEAFAKDSPWMLGDWDGTRQSLSEKGIEFTLGYIFELGSNVHGGYDNDRTMRYAHQFYLGSRFDLQKLMGIPDAEFQVVVTERSGRDLTLDRVADPRAGFISASTMEIYGAGQTWRLTKLFYRQTFLDKALDLKFGHLPVGDDFDVTTCEFQNWTFCGSLGGHGAGVWYSAPVSQWGGRVKYNFTGETYAQVGAYEFNPTLLEPNNGFKLNTSGRRGTTYLAEAGWTPKFDNGRLPGVYKVGAYRNTALIANALDDINGNPQPLTGQPLDQDRGKHGWYAYARQRLTADKQDPRRGLSVFAHYSANDKQMAVPDYQTELGMVYTGVFASRPEDDLGLAIGMQHINPAYAKRIRLQNEVAGLTDYHDPAYRPLRSAEYAAEIHYGFKLTPWLTVRPNVQYVAHPGGAYQVDDAVVVGLQVITQL